MGFPPGYNKKLLEGVFDSFREEYYKKVPRKSPE